VGNSVFSIDHFKIGCRERVFFLKMDVLNELFTNLKIFTMKKLFKTICFKTIYFQLNFTARSYFKASEKEEYSYFKIDMKEVNI